MPIFHAIVLGLVLVAAPARTAAPMLHAFDASLSSALDAIPYAGLAVVSLG